MCDESRYIESESLAFMELVEINRELRLHRTQDPAIVRLLQGRREFLIENLGERW